MLTSRLLQLPVAFFISSCVILAGCAPQSREPEPQAVRGKVTFDGKPATKARVTLHPVTHQGKIEPQTSKADDKGVFTFIPGVPAGEYQVTVVLMKKSDKVGEQVNLLPSKYDNPSTSGLVVTIVPGNNELDPINLNK